VLLIEALRVHMRAIISQIRILLRVQMHLLLKGTRFDAAAVTARNGSAEALCAASQSIVIGGYPGHARLSAAVQGTDTGRALGAYADGVGR
jgi:hypothetical protein